LRTSDLAFNFIRPADPDCGAILVHADLITKGSAQGLSEATIEDSDGHLLAHATTRCVVIDVPGPLPDPPECPIAWPEYPGTHPYQRPPDGTVLSQELWHTQDGITMLRGWQAGTLARSPLSHLLGGQVEHVEEGAIRCTFPVSRWLCGMGGTFYGDAVGLMADYAMHGAVQSMLPAGTTWATLDLKIRFLHPMTPDTRPLTARARVVHKGRHIAVTAAEISTGDHKLAALADASIMLLPHRSWAELAALTDEIHEVATLYQDQRGGL
jgi:uncharacterized protein (TIGR00369 family)